MSHWTHRTFLLVKGWRILRHTVLCQYGALTPCPVRCNALVFRHQHQQQKLVSPCGIDSRQTTDKMCARYNRIGSQFHTRRLWPKEHEWQDVNHYFRNALLSRIRHYHRCSFIAGTSLLLHISSRNKWLTLESEIIVACILFCIHHTGKCFKWKL